MIDTNPDISVSPAEPGDRAAIEAILTASWGEPRVAANGRIYDLLQQPALVARDLANGGRIVGIVTYDIAAEDIEIVSIDAVDQRRGIGTMLLSAITSLGTSLGLARLWLVTTNDNLDALRFYQRRGLSIEFVRPGAVSAARDLKPSIPAIGDYGIPIRDEIVLGRSLPHSAEL